MYINPLKLDQSLVDNCPIVLDEYVPGEGGDVGLLLLVQLLLLLQRLRRLKGSRENNKWHLMEAAKNILF